MQFQKFSDAYLEDLRRGEPSTEQHFTDYFSELIHLKLVSRIRSRDAMEDVRQETFVRFFTLLHKEGVRDAAALGSLINSVCNHVVLEYYRLCSRTEATTDVTVMHLPADNSDPFRELLAKDTQGIVRKILDKLDDRDSKLLKRVFLEDRDKDEICAEFGVDRNYLRVLLHRAKLSFRTLYAKQMSLKKSNRMNHPMQWKGNNSLERKTQPVFMRG